MTFTNLKKSITIIALIILSVLIITIPASADVPAVYVDDDFNEFTPGWNVTHFSDIQSGINNLEENGTLYISNGSYYGDVYVNKSITITGADRDNVIVTGQFTVESSNVIIEQLTIRDFIGYGYDFPAGIVDMSSDSTYRNLRLINNTYGIQLYDYSFNTVIDNNVFENNSDGIHTYYTYPHAVITNNIFTNNVENGIYIANSEYFTIANNYILNTAETGLTLSSSSHNLIYNNYFDNSFNVYVEGGANNSFNVDKTPGVNIIGGEYLGGNYWSDYFGIDLNGDGLGNTSYIIPMDAYDYHPLVFTHFYVDDDADFSWYNTNHVHTISEAIDNIRSFSTLIYVYNGTYIEDIYVDKTVSIIGESIEGVYVTNEWSDTFFIYSPGVILANMTIADNTEGEGTPAAIYDYSANL
jgi:parallel beta-helix repeat protein